MQKQYLRWFLLVCIAAGGFVTTWVVFIVGLPSDEMVIQGWVVLVQSLSSLVLFIAWGIELVRLFSQPEQDFHFSLFDRDWKSWFALSAIAVGITFAKFGIGAQLGLVDFGVWIFPLMYMSTLLMSPKWPSMDWYQEEILIYLVRITPGMLLNVLGMYIGSYVLLVVFSQSTYVVSLVANRAFSVALLVILIGLSMGLLLNDLVNLERVYSGKVLGRVLTRLALAVIIGFAPETVIFSGMEKETGDWIMAFSIVLLLYVIYIGLSKTKKFVEVPGEVGV
ncbi:hypothetical protein KC573_01430 [candidate division WWE3 bacterium]|uniref:Uncharacterized protein n=1 Tax=candidate division WWE3 bacterium TaxID=2053526 RepID=A0A955RW45_UNCKA|nr:hypothetical protein [candidate division WWE3 bacterium]